MESVAIRRELQARPARWCASWGRPKLADRAAEWGNVSSCSRSTDLAIKTPCTHRCWGGQEKYIRQRVCAAAFGRNFCLGYCSSSSSSVCCVRLNVRALLSSDGRSQQEPTIDPNRRACSPYSRRLPLPRRCGGTPPVGGAACRTARSWLLHSVTRRR
jgi:hypothetical protein